MRFAHEVNPKFLEDEEFVLAFTKNNCLLSVKPFQVYKVSKIGLFLGLHVNAFNQNTMTKALGRRSELRKIKIVLKNKFIKLNFKEIGMVRVIHIYAEHDKTYECCQALIFIYAKDKKNQLP